MLVSEAESLFFPDAIKLKIQHRFEELHPGNAMAASNQNVVAGIEIADIHVPRIPHRDPRAELVPIERNSLESVASARLVYCRPAIIFKSSRMPGFCAVSIWSL